MTKFLILKKRRDFLRAAKDITMVTQNVMIQAAFSLSPNPDNKARIGFTATKRLGKAFVRNRTKRRLRAVMQEVYEKYTLPDTDYVLIGRYKTKDCDFNELKSNVIWALKKINKQLQKDKSDNEDTCNSAH